VLLRHSGLFIPQLGTRGAEISFLVRAITIVPYLDRVEFPIRLVDNCNRAGVPSSRILNAALWRRESLHGHADFLFRKSTA